MLSKYLEGVDKTLVRNLVIMHTIVLGYNLLWQGEK